MATVLARVQMEQAPSFTESGNSSDLLASLMEPDVVLPSQFNAKGENGLSGGERKLMAAILSDGIEAYMAQVSLRVQGKKAKRDAIDWVETKDLSYVFSFDLVCEGLGIDPEYLRLGLARYAEAIEQKKQGNGEAPVWKKIRRPRKR